MAPVKSISLANLTLRRNLYYARVQVPIDAQAELGKKVLIRTTGHSDPLKAALAARPILALMRDEIMKARGAPKPKLDPLRTFVRAPTVR